MHRRPFSGWADSRRERIIDGSAPSSRSRVRRGRGKSKLGRGDAHFLAHGEPGGVEGIRSPQRRHRHRAAISFDWVRRNRLAASLAVSAPHVDVVIINPGRRHAGTAAPVPTRSTSWPMRLRSSRRISHRRPGDFVDGAPRCSRPWATVLRNEAPGRAKLSLFENGAVMGEASEVSSARAASLAAPARWSRRS